MRLNLENRMMLELLFLIPVDGELEGFVAMTVLEAWHDERYNAFVDASSHLIRRGFIKRFGHGQGYTYSLTDSGIEVRGTIRGLLGGKIG